MAVVGAVWQPCNQEGLREDGGTVGKKIDWLGGNESEVGGCARGHERQAPPVYKGARAPTRRISFLSFPLHSTSC